MAILGLWCGSHLAAAEAGVPLRSAAAVHLQPALFAEGQLVTRAPDGATAIAPGAHEAYFMRGSDSGWTIMVARRHGSRWSAPLPATFSGRWRDLDPAISPDGKTLVFASNRPISAGALALDAVYRGQTRTAQGMNLWWVKQTSEGWSAPARFSDRINSCSMTFAPSLARNGDLYYIGCNSAGSALILMRAPRIEDAYGVPDAVSIGDASVTVRDPAIAPDQDFIVVSTKSPGVDSLRLAIAFRRGNAWGPLIDLGDEVNAGTHAMGAQLASDGTTLLFYSDRQLPARWANLSEPGVDHVWCVSLLPLLNRDRSPTERPYQ